MNKLFKMYLGYMSVGIIASVLSGVYLLVGIHTIPVQFLFLLTWFILSIMTWNKLDINN